MSLLRTNSRCFPQKTALLSQGTPCPQAAAAYLAPLACGLRGVSPATASRLLAWRCRAACARPGLRCSSSLHGDVAPAAMSDVSAVVAWRATRAQKEPGHRRSGTNLDLGSPRTPQPHPDCLGPEQPTQQSLIVSWHSPTVTSIAWPSKSWQLLALIAVPAARSQLPH